MSYVGRPGGGSQTTRPPGGSIFGGRGIRRPGRPGLGTTPSYVPAPKPPVARPGTTPSYIPKPFGARPVIRPGTTPSYVPPKPVVKPVNIKMIAAGRPKPVFAPQLGPTFVLPGASAGAAPKPASFITGAFGAGRPKPVFVPAPTFSLPGSLTPTNDPSLIKPVTPAPSQASTPASYPAGYGYGGGGGGGGGWGGGGGSWGGSSQAYDEPAAEIDEAAAVLNPPIATVEAPKSNTGLILLGVAGVGLMLFLKK